MLESQFTTTPHPLDEPQAVEVKRHPPYRSYESVGKSLYKIVPNL